jgi:hypothetical protein
MDNTLEEHKDIDSLVNQVQSLKAELYDQYKLHEAETANLVKVYSTALLQASQVFGLQFEGRAPASVAEFQAALNELAERDYVQGP